MKESKLQIITQTAGHDRLCVATRTTVSYEKDWIAMPELMAQKRLALAAARLDLNILGAPTLLVGLRGEPPFPGVERIGADAFVSINGQRRRGDQEMRDALRITPAAELIRQTRTGRFWTGLGNVGMNQFCVAWLAGNLFYSRQDEPLLENGHEFDACLWIQCERWRIRFERVRFEKAGRLWIPLVNGRQVPGVVLIVSGQRLVERGIAIDPTADAAGRHAKSYVDKRHLILNAYTFLCDKRTGARALDPSGQPFRRDFGLDQVLRKPELLTNAIDGRIVHLKLQLEDVDGTLYDVAPTDLADALRDKSYAICHTRQELEKRQNAGERGLAYVDETAGECRQVYARSPYPLHFLAARENGGACLIDAVVAGASNNAGATVAGLAQDVLASGYREALLLDNGGDVVLVHRDAGRGDDWADPNGSCAVIPSSLRRTQWAALMVYPGASGAGIEVRHVAERRDGYFCIEWK
jgi:hypothetical protein